MNSIDYSQFFDFDDSNTVTVEPPIEVKPIDEIKIKVVETKTKQPGKGNFKKGPRPGNPWGKLGEDRSCYEGIKVGRLVVIQKCPAPHTVKRKGPTYYECRCGCGNTVVVSSGNITKYIRDIKTGKRKTLPSCGCGILRLVPGMIIGQLTLLESTKIHTDNIPRRFGDKPKKTRFKPYFKCRCLCGNEKVISSCHLTKYVNHGRKDKFPLSCGCLHHVNINDIVGKKIGKLTVVEITDKSTINKPSKAKYKCICECGNAEERLRGTLLFWLRNKVDAACYTCKVGIKMYKVGDVIDMLTVTEIIKKETPKLKTDLFDYRCRCACGKEVIKSRAALRYLRVKYTKSCGCETLKKKKLNVPNLRGVPLSYISSIKDGAKVRGIEYSVSDDYIVDLYYKQNKICVLSGKPIHFFNDINNPEKRTTASLDRIDNKKGYIEGNVQWVNTRLNMLKCGWSMEELKQMCFDVAFHFRHEFKLKTV